MESEAEYRKRMSEWKDPTQSKEWNEAYAACERAMPAMAFGKPIGKVDTDALRAAIEEALSAGVPASEMALFEKVAGLTPSAPDSGASPAPEQSGAEIIARSVFLGQEAPKEAWYVSTPEEEEARKKSLDKMQSALDLNAVLPTVLFGRVIGNVDVAALRTAIEVARDAGVNSEVIEDAEKKLSLAEGSQKP